MKYKDFDKVMAKGFQNITIESLKILGFCQLHFGADYWDADEGRYVDPHSMSWVHIPRHMYHLPLRKVVLELVRARDWDIQLYPISLQGTCPDGTGFQINTLTGDVFSGWGDDETTLQWVMNLLE